MTTPSGARLKRVRRPRVQITMDTDGQGRAGEQLPFVLGVLGDFTGDGGGPPKPFSERRFVDVAEGNVAEVMSRMRPALNLRVPNVLGQEDESTLAVNLTGCAGTRRVAGAESSKPQRGATRVGDSAGASKTQPQPPRPPSITNSYRLELAFESLEDFEPGSLVRRVPALRQLVDQRQRLSRLVRAETAARRPDAAARDMVRQWLPAAVDAAEAGDAGPWIRQVEQALARMDRLLQQQVDAILHEPRFQRLEAAWRGLHLLLRNVERAKLLAADDGTDAPILIRVLSATKKELAQDFRNALDFDQSSLWRLVYELEFGLAGGHPFGILLGDYEFCHAPEDLTVLTWMAKVGAAAMTPFVAGASPELFQARSFESLHNLALATHFDDPDFGPWRRLRDDPDARFLGLTLPRVLLRLPYEESSGLRTGFPYREDCSGADANKYLWGNAASAFGSVLVRAFAQTGWFADIRGLGQTDPGSSFEEGGGLVPDLPVHQFSTDAPGVATKAPTDVVIGEELEHLLHSQGLIPLCVDPGGGYAVFHTNHSLHKSERFDDAAKTASAQMAAMLQYVLCTSRFGHYLKGMAQRFLGDAENAGELETRLMRWASRYVTSDADAKPADKARLPLREAEIRVRESAEKPGLYQMIFRLRPHYQLDELSVRVQLSTQVLDVMGP